MLKDKMHKNALTLHGKWLLEISENRENVASDEDEEFMWTSICQVCA